MIENIGNGKYIIGEDQDSEENYVNDESELPWVEKYRPKDIDNIVSHKEIIKMLREFVRYNSFPHLLFFGPSGSGKTSTILCCAKELYGNYATCMSRLLNASYHRGVDIIRTRVKDFVTSKTSTFLPEDKRNCFKLVIMDEADSMTQDAQGMLRQIIEKNSPTTRFCLICNDIDKINPALQSRCAMFRFPPLHEDEMKERLEEISKTENMNIQKKSLCSVVKLSKGDMRSAINILQYANLTFDSKHLIEPSDIYSICGCCQPEINDNIFKLLLNIKNKKDNLQSCVKKIIEIVSDNNLAIYNMVDELKNKIITHKTIPTIQKIFIIRNLALVEKYDSINVDTDNNIMIIVSTFIASNNYIESKMLINK
jgi:DNA polymerase III delta prime subunit